MLRSKVKMEASSLCSKIQAHLQTTDEAEKSALILFRSFAKLQASSVRPEIKANPHDQAIDEAERPH